MSKFIKVATTNEMGEQPVKCVEVDGKKIALFDAQGAIFAVSDTCTHRGAPFLKRSWRERR
jgi:nitrite reductase/ring-hydroxylating ferredoxin subunit